MKRKNILICTAVLFFLILISALFLFPIFHPNINSNQKCHNKCIKDGWQDGQCDWPKNMDENEWNVMMKRQIELYNATFPYAEIENRGSCVEAFLGMKSEHYGNKGQCNCYCFNYKENYDEWTKKIK